MFTRCISINKKTLKQSSLKRSTFVLDTNRMMKSRLGVAAGLGVVELEVDRDCPWDSWRTIDVGEDVFVCAGSTLFTRHNLFISGNLEIRDGNLEVSHVLMLKNGGYCGGGISARNIISFGSIMVDGDLTVEQSIICEGIISCSGAIRVGGLIEAFAVESSDTDQVRRDNKLGASTRVEPLSWQSNKNEEAQEQAAS